MNDENKRPVIILALITAVCLIGDSMLYVVLPIYWREIGLDSIWQVGVLLSVNRFVRLPLNPLIGRLYQRISTRTGIAAATILAGVTTVSYGLAKGFLAWIILRTIWGTAWTFLRLGAYVTIVNIASDHNRGHLMGTYNGLFRIGSLIGMLFGGILADLYGLQPVAVSFGMCAFFALPLVFRYVSQPDDQNIDASPAAASANGTIWKEPAVLGVLTTGFFSMMALDSMFTSTLSHLIAARYPGTAVLWNISVGAAALAGILQAIRWTSGMWLSPWTGRLADGKWGRRRMLAGVLAVSTALLAVIPLYMPAELWIVVLMSVLITSTVLTTIVDTLASDAAAGSAKIAVMTAYAMAVDVGAAMGPLFGYSMESMFGLSSVYWISAVILLIMAAKWALSLKGEAQRTMYPM